MEKNDYEEFRSTVLNELAMSDFTSENLAAIGKCLDRVGVRYLVSYKGTALSTNTSKWQKCLKYYICSKGVEGLSPATLKVRGYVISDFFTSVGLDIDEVEPIVIRNWLYSLPAKDASKESYRVSLCSFWKWCVCEGLTDKNPMARIAPIKFPIELKDYLTRLDVEILRKGVRTKREEAVLEFMLSTGCRVSELIRLKIDQIGPDGSVKLFGKGRKERMQWLNPKAKLAMNDYLASRKDESEYVIVSERGPAHCLTKNAIQLILSGIRERSGLEKHVTPHTLRRTYATLALEQGAPIHAISKLLGHANVAVTERYAQTTEVEMHAVHNKYVV